MLIKKLYVIGILGIFFSGFFLFDSITTESSDLLNKILSLLKNESKPIEPLLPADFTINKNFKPGKGPVIGNVQSSWGEAYVFHQNESVAYTLSSNFPVFSHDTFVSNEKSRIDIILHDQSRFSLAGNSKLTIDECVYDPQKKQRSSTLRLLFGRARFIVKKLTQNPGFRVKTPTAVVAVRGSDFALAVSNKKIQLSSKTRKTFFPKINILKSAHAQSPVPLTTVLLTGPQTRVDFSGLTGFTRTVGPGCVCASEYGLAVIPPINLGVGPAAIMLNNIGPTLASLSMPLK